MGMCESSQKSQEWRKKTRTMKIRPLSNSQGITFKSERQIKLIALNSFAKYDASGDGTLNKSELTAFFKDIIERKKNKENRYDA